MDFPISSIIVDIVLAELEYSVMSKIPANTNVL